MSVPVWMQALAVAGGSAAGGVLRWRVSVWLNAAHAALPWGTVLVNVLGGLLIGLALAALPRAATDGGLRLLLVTGFLGGFTTFSTFSAESLALLQRGQVGWALAHMAVHVLGSLGAAGLGWALGLWWRQTAGAPA